MGISANILQEFSFLHFYSPKNKPQQKFKLNGPKRDQIAQWVRPNVGHCFENEQRQPGVEFVQHRVGQGVGASGQLLEKKAFQQFNLKMYYDL